MGRLPGLREPPWTFSQVHWQPRVGIMSLRQRGLELGSEPLRRQGFSGFLTRWKGQPDFCIPRPEAGPCADRHPSSRGLDHLCHPWELTHLLTSGWADHWSAWEARERPRGVGPVAGVWDACRAQLFLAL